MKPGHTIGGKCKIDVTKHGWFKCVISELKELETETGGRLKFKASLVYI